MWTSAHSGWITPNIDTWQKAIELAQPNDTVLFPDTCFTVTDSRTITIPKKVTVLTNTGTIFYKFFGAELDYIPLFLMKDSSSLIGMTIIGDNGEIGDPGVVWAQNAVKVDGIDVRILSCQFKNLDKWAIWGYNPSGLNIRNCRFENIRRDGYGYGVWIGGKGGIWPKMAIVDNNTFINCRSAVDGSGGYYSYTVSNNIFGEAQTFAVIARHGQGRSDKGGIHTWILNNIVLTPVTRNVEIPIPAVDTGLVRIEGNTFSRSAWVADTIADSMAVKYPDRIKVLNNVSITNSPVKLLSFYLKDTYIDYNPSVGYVLIEVNSKQLMQINSAGASMNWSKYYLDISRFLIKGNNTIQIKFVNVANREIRWYIDRIEVLGISGNTSAENTITPWRLTPNGFGSRFVTEEAIDGIYSLRVASQPRPSTANLYFNFKL